MVPLHQRGAMRHRRRLRDAPVPRRLPWLCRPQGIQSQPKASALGPRRVRRGNLQLDPFLGPASTPLRM